MSSIKGKQTVQTQNRQFRPKTDSSNLKQRFQTENDSSDLKQTSFSEEYKAHFMYVLKGVSEYRNSRIIDRPNGDTT